MHRLITAIAFVALTPAASAMAQSVAPPVVDLIIPPILDSVMADVADIVAVEGDPTTDINVVITNVRWVMKAGQVMVDKTRAGKSN